MGEWVGENPTQQVLQCPTNSHGSQRITSVVPSAKIATLEAGWGRLDLELGCGWNAVKCAPALREKHVGGLIWHRGLDEHSRIASAVVLQARREPFLHLMLSRFQQWKSGTSTCEKRARLESFGGSRTRFFPVVVSPVPLDHQGSAAFLQHENLCKTCRINPRGRRWTYEIMMFCREFLGIFSSHNVLVTWAQQF